MLRASRSLELGSIIALEHLLLLRLEVRGIIGELLHDLLLLAGAMGLVLGLLPKARRGHLGLWLWLRGFLLD